MGKRFTRGKVLYGVILGALGWAQMLACAAPQGCLETPQATQGAAGTHGAAGSQDVAGATQDGPTTPRAGDATGQGPGAVAGEGPERRRDAVSSRGSDEEAKAGRDGAVPHCECFDGLEPYGLETVSSKYGVSETVRRLEAAAQKRGFIVMAKIDHGAAAKKAGLELDPTVLVIFGKPEAGTKLMQQAASVGIDLPLHVLVWTQGSRAAMSYDMPGYLSARHQLESPVFDKMADVLEAVTQEAGAR